MMPTIQNRKDTAPRKRTEPDAVHMLLEDHKKVKKLFSDYKKLIGKGKAKGKSELAQQICFELMVHTAAEEAVFYPAMLLDESTERLIDEATVEHASAKTLIAQISSMKPTDPLYDATVTVLGEYINHHVREEEEEIFPLAKKRLDLAELGEEMSRKKEELIAHSERKPS
ncbi:hemerythrin domain-containing protein [Chitinimonas sp. PSY-7]|uniref:hemerythrin domain-containing protein n=1 Tax=Chitinimonas sp. PSY-7 TaxID=3459088 RepID=UPI0040402156